ncbi:MAG: hypothetical protein LQ338_007182 [Usnochroma carphineum]|nr:MAG: hypothetical protein LQ338_007182 [Usnochroma carphineum]
MAAPSDKTLADLAGKWKLNKSLSADVAAILALQGTSILIRKAIGSASVTLTISQPHSDEYRIAQTATAASIPGTTEQYILDGEWRTNKDAFFGEVKGRSQWTSLDDAKAKVEGQIDGSRWEASDDGKLILAEGGSTDGKWEAFRIWGFEEIGGERRYTQTVKVWNKEGEQVNGKMVYDFVG